jgi:hypothetical protein
MSWVTVAVGLGLVFPVLYVSAFLHELGHAVCGRLSGFVVTSFGCGTGQPFWVGEWRGTRVFLCRQRPFQGLTFWIVPTLFPGRWWPAFAYSGGILAHVLLVAAAALMCWAAPWGQGVWLVIAVLNALFAACNLIPLTFRVGSLSLRSDGALILNTLVGRSVDTPTAAVLQSVHLLRGLWEAAGDLRILQAYLLHAATVWVALGDEEYAAQLVEEAAGLPARPVPTYSAFLAAVRGLCAAAAGQVVTADDALGRAEKAFRELDHPGGLLVVRLWRCEVLQQQGEVVEAVQALGALRSHPLVRSRPSLRVGLLASRLAARTRLADGAGVEALRAEYEATSPRVRTRPQDLVVYRELARYSRRRGDEVQALADYGKALGAVRQLDASLADPLDRERFHRCQAPLLAEVQGCLRGAGRTEEAEKLEAFFKPLEEPGARTARMARRQRICLGWGIALTLLNLALVLAAVVAVENAMHGHSSRSGNAPFAPAVLLLLGLLGLFGALAFYYGALAAVFGRRVPWLRRNGGELVLILALAPWVAWCALLVLGIAVGWWQPKGYP